MLRVLVVDLSILVTGFWQVDGNVLICSRSIGCKCIRAEMVWNERKEKESEHRRNLMLYYSTSLGIEQASAACMCIKIKMYDLDDVSSLNDAIYVVTVKLHLSTRLIMPPFQLTKRQRPLCIYTLRLLINSSNSRYRST